MTRCSPRRPPSGTRSHRGRGSTGMVAEASSARPRSSRSSRSRRACSTARSRSCEVEKNYRSNLKSYIEGQLHSLDSCVADPGRPVEVQQLSPHLGTVRPPGKPSRAAFAHPRRGGGVELAWQARLVVGALVAYCRPHLTRVDGMSHGGPGWRRRRQQGPRRGHGADAEASSPGAAAKKAVPLGTSPTRIPHVGRGPPRPPLGPPRRSPRPARPLPRCANGRGAQVAAPWLHREGRPQQREGRIRRPTAKTTQQTKTTAKKIDDPKTPAKKATTNDPGCTRPPKKGPEEGEPPRRQRLRLNREEKAAARRASRQEGPRQEEPLRRQRQAPKSHQPRPPRRCRRRPRSPRCRTPAKTRRRTAATTNKGMQPEVYHSRNQTETKKDNERDTSARRRRQRSSGARQLAGQG